MGSWPWPLSCDKCWRKSVLYTDFSMFLTVFKLSNALLLAWFLSCYLEHCVLRCIHIVTVRDLRNEKGFGERWLWTCIARSTCVFGWNRPGKQHPSSFKIEKCFQLQGALPLTPWPGALPLDPTGGTSPHPHYRLALLHLPWATHSHITSDATAFNEILAAIPIPRWWIPGLRLADGLYGIKLCITTGSNLMSMSVVQSYNTNYAFRTRRPCTAPCLLIIIFIISIIISGESRNAEVPEPMASARSASL